MPRCSRYKTCSRKYMGGGLRFRELRLNSMFSVSWTRYHVTKHILHKHSTLSSKHCLFSHTNQFFHVWRFSLRYTGMAEEDSDYGTVTQLCLWIHLMELLHRYGEANELTTKSFTIVYQNNQPYYGITPPIYIVLSYCSTDSLIIAFQLYHKSPSCYLEQKTFLYLPCIRYITHSSCKCVAFLHSK